AVAELAREAAHVDVAAGGLDPSHRPGNDARAIRRRRDTFVEHALDEIEAGVPCARVVEALDEIGMGPGNDVAERGDAPCQLRHRQAEEQPRADGSEVELDPGLEPVVLAYRGTVVDAGHESAGEPLGPPARPPDADGRPDLEDDHDHWARQLAPARADGRLLGVAHDVADVRCEVRRRGAYRDLPAAAAGLLADDARPAGGNGHARSQGRFCAGATQPVAHFASARISSMVVASVTRLSGRKRLTRANRSAMPES